MHDQQSDTDRDALIDITIRAFDRVSIDQNIEARFGLVDGSTWQQRKASHIEADIALHPTGIFVYELDGTVVGYATSRPDPKTLTSYSKVSQ